METVETLIPDNEGNHLVVVLSFYEEDQKNDTFKIPTEFANLEIADISIEKLPFLSISDNSFSNSPP